MTEPLKRRGAPPPQPGGVLMHDIVWPRWDHALELTLLQYAYTGFWAHWVVSPESPKGRSRLCTVTGAGCPWHEHHELRWVGFLGCLDHSNGQTVIWAFGPEIAWSLDARHVNFVGLVGQRVRVSRYGKSGNGRQLVEDSFLPRLARVPPEPDIEPSIKRWWGLSDLPSRLVLPGDAPVQEGGDVPHQG